VDWALQRVTDLILQMAAGKAGKIVQAEGSDQLETTPQLRLRTSEIQRLLGKAPEQSRVIQILRGLQFPCEAAAGEPGVVSVQVPRWRKDIKRPVDLIEEVARIWGFENLESKLPLGGVAETEAVESRRRSYFQVRRIRRHLASLGFFEALNYGFTSPEILAKVHSESELKDAVVVANPVTADHSVMKPSLLSGLLVNLAYNLAHGRHDLRLFETRRVFKKGIAGTGADPRTETQVQEEMHLGLLMTGAEVDEFWQGKASVVDFYSIKGTLESIFELLEIEAIQFQPGAGESFLHPGQCATLLAQNKPIGTLGRLHPRVEKSFDFEQDVFYAEFKLDAILRNERRISTFREFSHFPEVERDFSVLVKDSVNAQMIRQLVNKSLKPLLRDFHFFDVYKGSRVPDGHVSYAFRVVLGAMDHTLTDAEIGQAQQKVMKELEKEFHAKFAGLS
jgi:phenylalanyl-tRNA synthetase beta chain